MTNERKTPCSDSEFLPDSEQLSRVVNDSSQIQRAVIFDVDGVLVDSYAAHEESWMRLAKETGVTFTSSDFAVTFGRTSRDILIKHWEIDPSDAAMIRSLDDRKEHLYRELVRQQFPSMDGAVEVIDELAARGWKLAVGSSGPPENVELALASLERAASFDGVVTGRDVTRGKPDPQVFLLAAERLQIVPENCIVIEDATAGIEAARAAGMACVALLSTGRQASDFDRHAPDLMVSSLRELTAARLAQLLHTHPPAKPEPLTRHHHRRC